MIDFILNLAGLLLWFHWRARKFDTIVRTASILPAGRANQEKPSHRLGCLPLVALLGLVCARAYFYWLLGPTVEWTGCLDLGPITVFFRAEPFWWALLFSSLSFTSALVLAYSWLIGICVINRSLTAPDPILRLIRLQLGRVSRWPVYAQAALPWLVIVAAWPGLHALLTHAGVMNSLPSAWRLLLQGCLIGLAALLSLKYLIVPLLIAGFLARYIYFGRSPIWEFFSITARQVLAPLQHLPLRVGRMDFAPLAGIALTLLVFHWLPRLVMFELNRRNLNLWPQ